MNNLKVIENELVAVYETSDGEKVVNGTELYEVLGVKSNYRDWVKNRLNDVDAIENDDFQSFAKNLAKGRPTTEYLIKLDTAKEMAMLERNEKGKQVRRYFIQVEKKYKNNVLSELSPELQAILLHDKKLQQVDGKINAVNEDLQKFKEELPILPVEASLITDEVKRVGVKCLGGKASNSYNDNSIRMKVYCDIYKQLCRQFGNIRTYKLIKRNQCDLAIQFIKSYELPFALGEQIQDCNAQMNLEVA